MYGWKARLLPWSEWERVRESCFEQRRLDEADSRQRVARALVVWLGSFSISRRAGTAEEKVPIGTCYMARADFGG